MSPVTGDTFYIALLNWLKHEDRGRSDRSTVKQILELYPDRPIHEVTDRTFRDAVIKSPGTFNRYVSVANAALNLWANEKRIQITPLKKRESPQGRKVFLSYEEWNRLKAELPKHLLDMAEFSISTGIRQGNLLTLKWSQIILQNRTMWVHADQSKSGKIIHIPLNDTAMEVLARVDKVSEYVFTYQGQPIKNIHGGVKPNGKKVGAWGKALERANIKGFTWHGLRHTWASWHVMSGTPLSVLKELGGWASLEMVQNYAHLAPSHTAAWANNSTPKAEKKGTEKGTLTAHSVKRARKSPS